MAPCESRATTRYTELHSKGPGAVTAKGRSQAKWFRQGQMVLQVAQEAAGRVFKRARPIDAASPQKPTGHASAGDDQPSPRRCHVREVSPQAIQRRNYSSKSAWDNPPDTMHSVDVIAGSH